MRRQFSVVIEKMIAELNGIPCLALDESPPPKKQIMSSRSFGRPVQRLSELQEAISSYADRACVKLRKQKSEACGIHIFLETNFFRQDKKQYQNSANYYFTHPTADTRLIINIAKACLDKIYRRGFEYKKTGIMLLDLIPATARQYDLLSESDSHKSQIMMQTLDKINERFGKRSLFLASEGTTQPWKMQRKNMSSRYTTRLEELLVVKCK
jgi:DNA polymerase V